MNALVQYAAFLLTVTVLAKPVGHYMACVFEGDRTPCQGRSRLHRDSVRLCLGQRKQRAELCRTQCQQPLL